MKLHEIREKFGDQVFTIATYNHLDKNKSVRPKQVTIKENLTVWDRASGNCIINGMRDVDFIAIGTAHLVEKEFKRTVEEMNPDLARGDLKNILNKPKGKKL